MQYRAANTPIPDTSFLSKTSTELCRGVSTYWVYPSCDSPEGKIILCETIDIYSTLPSYGLPQSINQYKSLFRKEIELIQRNTLYILDERVIKGGWRGEGSQYDHS